MAAALGSATLPVDKVFVSYSHDSEAPRERMLALASATNAFNEAVDFIRGPGQQCQARATTAEARKLIEQCGYGRRLPELQDALAAL